MGIVIDGRTEQIPGRRAAKLLGGGRQRRGRASCLPRTETTTIPFDAVDPAGPSGAALLAQAGGMWTGTITWLEADPSLVTVGHGPGSTVATLSVANPGATRKVVGRDSDGAFLAHCSHTETDVDVVLQSDDGLLNERRMVPLRSRTGLTIDFKDQPLGGTLRVELIPDGALKVIFFDLSIGFDTSATGELQISIERSLPGAKSLRRLPLARFQANRPW